MGVLMRDVRNLAWILLLLGRSACGGESSGIRGCIRGPGGRDVKIFLVIYMRGCWDILRMKVWDLI